MERSHMRRLSFVVSALIGLGVWLPAHAPVAQTQTVSDVEVQEVEGVTRVILRGGRDYVYTAFMRKDPPQLIVEIPDLEFDGVASPIQVGNGLVSRVTLGSIEDPQIARHQARVSIELERLAEYELTASGTELMIEIQPGSPAEDPQPATSGPENDEVPAAFDATDTSPAYATQADQDEEQTEAGAPERYAGATGRTRMVGLRATGNRVRIATQGGAPTLDSFRLENPARLVVDLLGAELANVPTRQRVGRGAIDQVRVGAHSDKVRVVVDLLDPKIAYRVDTEGDAVVVRLGDDLARASSEESSATEVPIPTAKPGARGDAEVPRTFVAAATEGSPARIASTHFESLPDLDRIVVTLDREVEAKLVSPDAQTLIVRLPLARIAPSVERRVDTREFGGPVEIFSVFQTPDISPDEVRVVLKRHAGIEGRLVWADGQLHIELPRPASAVFSAEAGPGGTRERELALSRDLESRVPAAPGDASLAGPGQPNVPASLPTGPFDDPFAFEGPADPASIDILEEGGFSEEKEYVGRRVSLDFKDADIANILRLIAEVSDLNVIAGEEVEGTVTIRLVDVPWDQALDVILLTKGLGFVRVGNVLRIAPLETIKLEAEQRLQERRAKEKLEDLVVKLQPVNYADVAEVKKLVNRLLSKRGSVDVDGRTNTLIIKDIPSVVQEATALLKAIDTQTPQVLIEAKIVEANLSFSRTLGTQWGIGYTPPGRSGNEDFAFPDILNTRDNLITGGNQQNNFISSTPGVGALNGLLTLGILSLDDRLQLDLLLQAAESNNKGKVISAPRVVTIDNKEATIKQGVAIAFTEATADRITTSFIDAVLELKVQPHITANRSIIMAIKVSKNAPQLSASSGAITGISKNEADTEALVRDGETIVLGGIYVVDSGRQNQKLPFLADIPLLGTAFRNSITQDERRELLIFVTPRVILGRPSDV